MVNHQPEKPLSGGPRGAGRLHPMQIHHQNLEKEEARRMHKALPSGMKGRWTPSEASFGVLTAGLWPSLRAPPPPSLPTCPWWVTVGISGQLWTPPFPLPRPHSPPPHTFPGHCFVQRLEILGSCQKMQGSGRIHCVRCPSFFSEMLLLKLKNGNRFSAAAPTPLGMMK